MTPISKKEVENKVVLTRETLVPVGVVCVVCAAIMGGVLWINNEFSQIQQSLRLLNDKSTRIEIKQERAEVERWTKEKMGLWIELFKANNKDKDIIIPGIPK